MKRARDQYPVSYQSAVKRRKASIARAGQVVIVRPPPVRRPTAYANRSGKKLADMKCIDINMTTGASNIVATTSTNDLITPVNLIQLGSGSWNRIGRTIKCHKLSWRLFGRYSLAYSALAPERRGLLRVTMVWDKSPNGATIPKFSDIFGRTTQTGSETVQLLDMLRYDNMDRFTILSDQIVAADPANFALNVAGSVSTESVLVQGAITLVGKTSSYSDSNSPMTIADISTGALYVILRATENTPEGHWELTDPSYAKLHYTD